MKNTCALRRVHDRTEIVISTEEGRSFLPIHCFLNSSSNSVQTYVVCYRTLFQLLALLDVATKESLNALEQQQQQHQKKKRKCIFCYTDDDDGDSNSDDQANAFIVSNFAAKVRVSVPFSFFFSFYLFCTFYRFTSLSFIHRNA